MNRPFTALAWLALLASACGAPGTIDETTFPPLGETGYGDSTAGVGGINGTAGVSGTGGAGPSGTGGAGVSGTGGNVPLGSGGTANTAGSGGSPGTGGQAGGGDGPAGDCPDDIAVLFNRPGSEGGCDGAGCHAPTGLRPDLTSPGVEARLLNIASSCRSRPYISATDSFLANKLVGAPPDCGGYPMPFSTPSALNAADKQCILNWIDEVAAQ